MLNMVSRNLIWYQDLLEKNGIKKTKQKDIVLTILLDAGKHLTVEDIYRKANKDAIGKATIYRCIKVFQNLGIVKELPLDGVRYYELKIFGKKPLHIHFQCYVCDSVIDIDDTEVIIDYIKLNQKIERKLGYDVKDSNITLLGICNHCKRSEENDV